MSFILDAVKKSEAERRFSQADPIQSWHYQPNKPASNSNVWVILLLIINTLLVVAVILWAVRPAWLAQLGMPQMLEQSAQVAAAPELEPAPTPATLPAEIALSQSTEPQISQPVPASTAQPVAQEMQQITPAASITEEADEVITPSVASNAPNAGGASEQRLAGNIPDLESLPESLMIHIPAIAFSSHLYSSEPGARQVVVNGQKLREGDFVNQDLQLLQIREKIVVFQQFDQPFQVLLSRYWVRSQ